MRKLDNPDYGYVVFSASYVSPIDKIGDIEKELARKGYSGFVMFDLLLSSGNGSSRFQKMYFDGEVLALRTASRAENVHDELRRFFAAFYRKHFDKLDTSILTKPTRYKIRKGLVV